MAEQKQDEDEIEECEGEEVKTVSFFHQTVDDFMAFGVISTGDDSAFLRPDIYKKFDLEGKKKKEGSAVVEGWFGNSLKMEFMKRKMMKRRWVSKRSSMMVTRLDARKGVSIQ